FCRSMQLPESYQIGRERVQDDAIGGHLGDGPLNEADSRAEAEGRAMRIEGREPCVVSHRELEDAAAAVLPVVVEEHPEYPCAKQGLPESQVLRLTPSGRDERGGSDDEESGTRPLTQPCREVLGRLNVRVQKQPAIAGLAEPVHQRR